MFGFPDSHRKDGFKHKKNLLRTAIFQLKYPKVETIRENHEKLERQLLSKFPNKKDLMRGEAKIRFEPSKTPILESASGAKNGFEFRTEDDKKIFRIAEEAFSYTVFGDVYMNFEETSKELEGLLLPALETCGIDAVSWVSARKINIMEPSVSDNFTSASLLNFAFNENIISHIMAFPNTTIVKSGVSQVTLKTADYRLNFSYGLLPKPPEVKMDKPQLILDIDLISESQFQVKDVIPEWRKINQEMYNIFNWSISEQLKASLDE